MTRKTGQAHAQSQPQSQLRPRGLQDEGEATPEDDRSSSFMVYVVATALRSLNRCLVLLRELPQDQVAVLVLGRAQKTAVLAVEVQKLMGLWRLLHPVLTKSTYRASNRRLKFLLALLSSDDGRVWLERLVGHIKPDTAKHRSAIDKLTRALAGPAAERASYQAGDSGPYGRDLSVAELTIMVEQESRAWRAVPTTALAQDLVIDRGFLRTYQRGQACSEGQRSAAGQADAATAAELTRWHLWVLCFAVQLKLLGQGPDDERQRNLWYAEHLAECLDETRALARVLGSAQFAELADSKPKTARRAERVIRARIDRLVERREPLGSKTYHRAGAQLRYDVAGDVERLQSQNALNMLLLA